jgi:hypothetical protein
LQKDEWLETPVAVLEQMELQSFAEPVMKANSDTHCRAKPGKKIQYSGAVGSCVSGTMNALSLRKPLPLLRTVAERNVILKTYEEEFLTLQRNLRRQMIKLPEPESKNAYHTRTTPINELVLNAGQIFITQADGSHSSAGHHDDLGDVLLIEDDHCDGSGGMLHSGWSFFTRRFLKVWIEGRRPIYFLMEPGSFWLTNSSSFRHQAIHVPCEDSNLCTFGNLKGCSLSVMLRSCTFPFDNSRLAGRTPSPQDAFKAATDVITRWLVECGSRLSFPTLDKVVDEHEKLKAKYGGAEVKKRPSAVVPRAAKSAKTDK